MTYVTGQFVRYKVKNEVGLIGEVCEEGKLRVWWHTGGTRAQIDVDLVELVEVPAVDDEYSNAYAISSLLKRREILLTYGLQDPRLYDLVEGQ